MDFLQGKIKPLYFQYLGAAFGSALISSIYSIIDMAMVGQYQGPEGTAALAVVAPIWNIIYSLGLLMGIGGSVIFSTIRGKADQTQGEENEYFTTALIGAVVLATLAWIMIIFFDDKMLLLFGASEETLTLAQRYVVPIKFVLPCFLFNQMLAAFLRNDHNPGLATASVLVGGIFNVFGDYFFVFTLDMGIMGAGLATAAGSVLSFVVMLSHFFTKKCSIRIRKPRRFLYQLRKVAVTGFSTFFIDVAMGILTIFFNRQIMKYLGTNALSVYGIIINVSTFAQCCAYSVGQAAQPLISVNYGAGQGERIRETLKYALGIAAVFALFWTVLSQTVPNLFVRIFMTPTEEILVLAPQIIRSYGLSFILLPLNIFSTYYFQALMKPTEAFIVSVARGVVVSGILIFLLPIVAGSDSLWFAMPITELIVAAYAVYEMVRCTKNLEQREVAV